MTRRRRSRRKRGTRRRTRAQRAPSSPRLLLLPQLRWTTTRRDPHGCPKDLSLPIHLSTRYFEPAAAPSMASPTVPISRSQQVASYEDAGLLARLLRFGQTAAAKDKVSVECSDLTGAAGSPGPTCSSTRTERRSRRRP